jgi:hypothetical protein
LPNSNGTRLKAGQPASFQVQVKNTGTAPTAYFADPRLASSTTLNLVSLNDAAVQVPLSGASSLPLFLVPSHTSAIDATASVDGSTPIMLDAQAPAGDPDIGSNTGASVSGSFSSDPVAAGAWDVAPDVVGPFGAMGVPNENATTGMTTTSNAFDPAVTSSTGDMWQGSVNPSALSGLSPVVIGPGQTGTITVTITPSGSSGSQNSGTLYVDAEDLFQFQVNTNVVNLNTGNPEPNGSEVAAIPYRYTVK